MPISIEINSPKMVAKRFADLAVGEAFVVVGTPFEVVLRVKTSTNRYFTLFDDGSAGEEFFAEMHGDVRVIPADVEITVTPRQEVD